MNHIIEKKLAIVDSVFNTATVITGLVKQLPKTGKQGRNIFIKTYNRRPQNKKKRAFVLAQIAIVTRMGAMRIATIAAQHIPKFKSGSA